jgi:predicted RNA-binding Zn-ribbon protein involved in translation (DUF1610 family)
MFSKYKDNKNVKQTMKEVNTLDNKHKNMVKYLSNNKKEIDNIKLEIQNINKTIEELDMHRDNFNITDINQRAVLLDKKENYELELNKIDHEEMNYYDNAGDLITNYYSINENDIIVKDSYNILDLLSNKQQHITVDDSKTTSKALLLEKYCQRIDGTRINQDDGSKRIKYCNDCNIEKLLITSESSYICPFCGDVDTIILDEDKQIKDYSPYRRLNHFKEWLNQFQAKQSPEIPEQVFIDIIRELNKSHVTDLSTITRIRMKNILKKLKYNSYYEHIHYIINKLNTLPPPKITRDMERVFISMFVKIQEPWEQHKSANRKNFLSYSYVLHKFCELLELDHLLECFPLHKDSDKIMENDQIWEKICKDLNWEYISSSK